MLSIPVKNRRAHHAPGGFSFFNIQSGYNSRSAMTLAAFLPAPMAEMTVAAPVTTRRLLTCPIPSRLSSSTYQGLMGSLGIGSDQVGLCQRQSQGVARQGAFCANTKRGHGVNEPRRTTYIPSHILLPVFTGLFFDQSLCVEAILAV